MLGLGVDSDFDVSDWREIISVLGGYEHILGLRADGVYHIFGIREDGRAIAIGNNEYCQIRL